MLQFGYCLWLSPESNSELYSIISDFSPHISLKTKLDLPTSLDNYNHSSKPTLPIKILDIPIVTIEEDFHALQFNVEVVGDYLSLPFQPNNPHISFIYKYDQAITQEEIKKITEQINFDKVYQFNNYKLMYCNGHFKDWYDVNQNYTSN